MGIYSISDLEELTGVKTHTLRVWEKRYGILRPQRTDTNIRFYEESDLHMLRLVQKLNSNGIRISRIAGMSLEELEREASQVSLKQEDFEARLLEGLENMDVTQMDSVMDSSIRLQGFDSTLLHLILPIMEKMQVMWLSENIGEAHEACFREVIKRKTIREIDSLPHNCSGPKVMIFLPAGNQQELSHLFMHYFLRKQGLCVTDMGCEINVDCAASALQKCPCDCVIIVNEDPVHWQFGNFLTELASRTSLPILVSGRASEHQWLTENEHVIMIDGIEDTLHFVSRLHENLQNHLS